jgi:LysR family transcriptional regulator for metE and metH
VASGRGVAVLPDWVLREVKYHSDYITRPITVKGLTRRMFAAMREDDMAKPYMAHVVRLARTEAVKLQRA